MTTKEPAKLFTEELRTRLIACYRVCVILQKTLERYNAQSVPDLSYALEYLSLQEMQILREMASVRDNYKDGREPPEAVKLAHGMKMVSFMLGMIGMGHMVWLRFVVMSCTKASASNPPQCGSTFRQHQGALLRTMDSLMKALSDSSDGLASEINANKLAQMDALIRARRTIVSDSTSPWEFSVASTIERWRELTLASMALSIENSVAPTEALFAAAAQLFPLGMLLVKALQNSSSNRSDGSDLQRP